MKRANKTGSIVKRNDKKRRLPYSVYLDGGNDPDTFKRRRIFLGSFAKRSEAQDFLERYLHGLVRKEPYKIVPLKDIWQLYKEDKQALTGHFSKNYDSVWKLYIEPKLAGMDVSAIKTMHMQNIINGCNGAAVQKQIRAVFTGLFSYAVANDLTDRDYAATLKTKSVEKNSKHNPFTTQELRWLWQHTDQDVIKIILMQAYTGTRKTELAGIRMENVHLAERYMIGGEKTAAGRNRVIPIAECILPFVRHFYAISRFSKFDLLIMPDMQRGISRKYTMANLDDLYRKNFPAHCTHDARHTFITLCSNYGQPESIVKKIVGHVGANVTSDVYTHKTTKQLLKVVNSLPYGTEMYMSPEEKEELSRVATG